MGLIDIFIKPADESQAGQTKKQEQPSNAAPMQQVHQQVQTPAAAAQMAQPMQAADINEDIERGLWKVLSDKNLPGPDYMEVKVKAAANEAIIPDEATRYCVAFNMLKTDYPDFTKQQILDSIDKYVQFIEEERADGKKECDEKRQKNVGRKMDEIKKLTERAEEIQKQIAVMQQDYQDALAKIGQLNAEVSQATVEIDREEQVFNNTVNSVVSKLNADKAVMASLAI